MSANSIVRGEGDPGLFGPGSVAWRIHADPIALIGGLRALLYQALDPLALAGVMQHSRFKEDSWNRLLRTTDYVMATTFGDTAAAEAAIARVKAIHSRVKGVDPVTGRAYSADDPESLLWVHACEVDSFLEGYRRFVGGVSDDDADRYVAEMAVVAEKIGIPAPMVPRSLRGLREYLDSRELWATPYAMDAMRFVLLPPVPWPGGELPKVPGSKLLLIPGRAGFSLYALATIAILPGRVRKAYRLPWVPLTPPLRVAALALSRTMRRLFEPPPSVQAALTRYTTFAG